MAMSKTKMKQTSTGTHGKKEETNEPDFWRQLDIIPTDDLEDLEVTVIGAGGIGSPTVLALTKMGVNNVTVYDHDTVENHNLPNQLYKLSDCGASKVDSLKTNCAEFTGVEITAVNAKYTDQKLKGVVISGVDSMKARKAIWKKVRYNPAVPLYVDGRMGAEVARIYAVNPCDVDDVRKYEETLYDDDKASELPCTAKAIIYNVFVIAGMLTSYAKRYAVGKKCPFEMIYDLETLTFIVDW